MQIRATFTSGDFAYDWVKNYLESYHIWDESHSFRVLARNPNSILKADPSPKLGFDDGHPDPVYEPAAHVPELFRWRGYWMSVVRIVITFSATFS
jgi:hypothetical protein